jgi:hypothetical protein
MKRTWTIIGVGDVPRSFKWYQALFDQPDRPKCFSSELSFLNMQSSIQVTKLSTALSHEKGGATI